MMTPTRLLVFAGVLWLGFAGSAAADTLTILQAKSDADLTGPDDPQGLLQVSVRDVVRGRLVDDKGNVEGYDPKEDLELAYWSSDGKKLIITIPAGALTPTGFHQWATTDPKNNAVTMAVEQDGQVSDVKYLFESTEVQLTEHPLLGFFAVRVLYAGRVQPPTQFPPFNLPPYNSFPIPPVDSSAALVSFSVRGQVTPPGQTTGYAWTGSTGTSYTPTGKVQPPDA